MPITNKDFLESYGNVDANQHIKDWEKQWETKHFNSRIKTDFSLWCFDMLSDFLLWLDKEHEETLPKCPFTGCSECNREVKAVQNIFGDWYVTSMYKNHWSEYCMGVATAFYKTKEEAEQAWRKAVGNDTVL